MSNYLEFFKQFRQQFKTTGAIAPSSGFLAKAMCWPMEQANAPRRILEVGPGTGAVTNRLVRSLKPGDVLDLVEINEAFADLLRKKFETDDAWKKVADQCQIHVMPLQDFQCDEPYGFVISGLPMNNFEPALVSDLLETMFRLMKEGAVLSYFEYIYIRSVKCVIARGEERKRIREIDRIAAKWQDEYRFERNWVFPNVPPAWVQHLRKPLVATQTPAQAASS
ncbi:MAG: class I SAM-dependent methyltransferase [Planctomycetaceae bacterium]